VRVVKISVPHSQIHTIFTLTSTWSGLTYACGVHARHDMIYGYIFIVTLYNCDYEAPVNAFHVPSAIGYKSQLFVHYTACPRFAVSV